MGGGEGEKKGEENLGPCLSLQQSWLSACLLRVGCLQDVSQSLFSCRDEVPETPKTRLPIHCFPKGTWKGQSGIRGKRKVFLSKALALKNVTK